MSRPSTNPWDVQRAPSVLDSRTTSSSMLSGGGASASEIDMRLEISKIMEAHGHYVYLRRAQDRRCGCWNEQFREARTDCEFCTGTGWSYVDEMVVTRRMPLADPGVMAAMGEQKSPVGIFNVSPDLFWFEHTVKPSSRDLILEVTLGEDGLPVTPVNIERLWNVSLVHDYRDKYGRIEYWACWVKLGQLGKE